MRQKTPVLYILLASAFMINVSCRAQVKESGDPHQGAQAVVNICEAPYFADPLRSLATTDAESLQEGDQKQKGTQRLRKHTTHPILQVYAL